MGENAVSRISPLQKPCSDLILRLVFIFRMTKRNLGKKSSERITVEKIIPELSLCQSSHNYFYMTCIWNTSSDCIRCHRNIFFIWKKKRVMSLSKIPLISHFSFVHLSPRTKPPWLFLMCGSGSSGVTSPGTIASTYCVTQPGEKVLGMTLVLWIGSRGFHILGILPRLLHVDHFLGRGVMRRFKYQWANPLNGTDLWLKHLIWNPLKKVSYFQGLT